MQDRLDCVVVGHYEYPLASRLERSERLKDYSGQHRYYELTSCYVDGQRIRYFDVITDVLNRQTGAQRKYNHYDMPNMAAHYLGSFLRRHGLNAELVNFVNHDWDRFVALLRDAPRCVALTTTFYFDNEELKVLIATIREHSPDSVIAIGGPYMFNVFKQPRRVQDQIFAALGADVYVHESQGESTLEQLCRALRDGRAGIAGVPNLTYRGPTGAFERSARVEESNALADGSIDWSLFDPATIGPTAQMRTARSCAFKCAFCSFPSMAGALTVQDLDVVENELRQLCAAGVRQVMFIDDTFNIPLHRFKDLCRRMIKAQYGLRWYCQFRVANADEEAIDLLAESGCEGVLLGIESGDATILRAMNKGATPERYRRGLGMLRERGIIVYASFIIGFPGETVQTAHNTLDFIREVQPDYYALEPYFHNVHVPIARESKTLGIVKEAYSWRHNSMDWKQAFDLVTEGVRTIRGPVFLPASADLWGVAYLLGLGFSRERVRELMQIAAGSVLDGPAQGGSNHARSGMPLGEQSP